MKLTSPITDLKGVGDELAKKLAVLGISTLGDLIENYPRRYEDYSNVVRVDQLKPGICTIEAEVSQVTSRYVRRGLHITEAMATDARGSVRLVWFNQPYRGNAIKKDQPYYIAGEYGLRRSRFSILNPSLELVSSFPVNTARIIPIYRETKDLKSFSIRKLIREALLEIREMPEVMPRWIVEERNLLHFKNAVEEMHFPSGSKNLEHAKRSLGFREIFELTLAALLNKYEFMKQQAVAIPFKEKLAKEFVGKLSFNLTDAQRRVIWQAYQDMVRTHPMNRLLEGDVGSGKTVVAAMIALMAIKQGFQVAFMAPTEILARQHADTLHDLLSNVGYGGSLGLLIGGLTASQKETIRKKIASGEVKFVVGTHALVAERVDMHNLGLIIIDEQHRFGVEQRKKLQAKAGHMPHVLHMTATPIPRSLALTLYGELDVSVLDEMPPGRKITNTKIVSPNSRPSLYIKINKEIEKGRQVFVVCPLIEGSKTSGGISVEEVYERLSKKDFKNRKVGLLHGRLKPDQKDKVMKDFINNVYDILVSTTVVEVGVDVPNASVIIIEGVEKFGLAQIHQLRGRVGRGGHQSYCYLILSSSQPPSPRIRALESTTDGFKLAELDLEIRGPGAIYGTNQHGILDLRVAKLSDTRLIAAARKSAQEFIDRKENLKKYPQLNAKIKRLRTITNLN